MVFAIFCVLDELARCSISYAVVITLLFLPFTDVHHTGEREEEGRSHREKNRETRERKEKKRKKEKVGQKDMESTGGSFCLVSLVFLAATFFKSFPPSPFLLWLVVRLPTFISGWFLYFFLLFLLFRCCCLFLLFRC